MFWRNANRRVAGGSTERISRFRREYVLRACLIEPFEPRILISNPPLPTISGADYNIENYGATDTSSNNAADIQAAITAASNAGGGTVEVPATSQPFLSGPITLASNINLQIDSGAELQAVPYSSYPNAGNTSSISNFITANNISNFEITGPGTIDGNGSAWWSEYNSNKNIKRPFLIDISDSSKILIQNVTVQNSPQENIAFGGSSGGTNVTINDVTVSCPSSSPNTDGIDPAGSNFLIENCNISDGDDDIAVKPQDVGCSNIVVENCTIGSGHGISVGGQTNDGLNGMTVTNVTFNDTTDGLRLKAGPGNGGLVENVTFSDITLTGVSIPIYITSWYESGSDTAPSDPADASGEQPTGTAPTWENITFSNITATGSNEAGELYGLPEKPLSNIVFDDVKITASTGMELDFANNVTWGDGSTISVSSGSNFIGTSSFSTPYSDTNVAEGYTDQDIDSPGTAGTTLFNPNTSTWQIIGGGAGIGGSVDQFNFASMPISGNVTYFAEVTSQSNSNAAAAAGVMIRESTSDTSAFADAVVTPSDGVEFQWRNSDGGTTGSASVSAITAPIWVEIQRSGSSFSAFYSSNGTTWTQIGTTQTISMNSSAFAGLAVSANNNSSTSTADFSNVSGPTTSTPTAASPEPVPGTSSALSVVGADSSGASGLIYNWSATGPASVSFTGNTNDTNAAKNITANFTAAGLYDFTVGITDTNGLTISYLLNVLVNQTPTSVIVSPSSVSLGKNGTEQFTAAATDQFGAAIAPVVYNWTVPSGGGTIVASTGLYTAPATAGTATVKATDGSASGVGAVTVGPVVTTPAAANPSPVTGTTTSLTVQASESGSSSGLTYTWSSTGPASVAYSANGSTSSNDTTATFTEAGSYDFTVTVTDTGGLSSTSSVAVTVNQTLTAVTVTPSSQSAAVNGSAQFSASATDQFGNAISSQTFNWSVNGTSDGNSISSSGDVTLGSTAGTFTVTAADGSVQGTANVTAVAAPTLNTFQINDGNVQRSMIDSLTLVFSQQVTLASNAITLNQYSQTNGSPTSMDFSLNSPDGGTTWVLTFTDPSYIGGSLPDGGYILTVNAADVTNAYNQTLAGGNQNFSFSRLYGDFTGQGVANAQDFTTLIGEFGQVLSPSQWYLDYYDQSLDNASDFVQFTARFGLIAVAPPSPDVLTGSAAIAAQTQPVAAAAPITPLTVSSPESDLSVSSPTTSVITPAHNPAPTRFAAAIPTYSNAATNAPNSPGPDFTDLFFSRANDPNRLILH